MAQPNKEGEALGKGAGKKQRRTRFASKHDVFEIPGRAKPAISLTGKYAKALTVSLSKKRAGVSMKKQLSKRRMTDISEEYQGKPVKLPESAFQGEVVHLNVGFNEMLNGVREAFKAAEPIPVTETNPRDVKTKEITGKLILKDVAMSGFFEFVLNKIEVSTPANLKSGLIWLKYEITVPHLHVAGKYEMEGTHNKVDVKSAGDFEGDVLFYKNTGFVTFFEDDDEALQVEEYKLKLHSLGINAYEKGLQFGILTSAELKTLLDEQLHEYLLAFWKQCSPKAGEMAKDKLNVILRRINKDRKEAALAGRNDRKLAEEARALREEKMRKCRDMIANRGGCWPPGYPPTRDQSLLGWLHPPKHPLM